MQRKNFSLIELLIVVAIIGALTALILPQFDVSEAEAKDAGCDYSQYGTMRTLTQFRSLNGVYPTGWHTGLEAATSPDVKTGLMGILSSAKMPEITAGNIDKGSSISKLTQNEINSLAAAGIGSLGFGYGEEAVKPTTDTTVVRMDKQWFEDSSFDWAAKAGTIGTATPVTFNGRDYAKLKAKYITNGNYSGFIVLFASPTVDWENYYTGGDLDAPTASKVSVAQEGKCPWVKDIFGYYIGYFAVDGVNSTKAKLIGTTCPECGPLNP